MCFWHYFQRLFLNLRKTESIGIYLHLLDILKSLPGAGIVNFKITPHITF